ncbi:MAG TPA: hypothetical protein VHV57_07850 [Acidimicrobiales bacterium]|jgi:hypothetical protein|nr:hypothetical protein [Acidimicrobiales bacterium]
MYLRAATQTFAGKDLTPSEEPRDTEQRFRYTKTAFGSDIAILEFETSMQGTHVNGVDIIRCNEAGRVVEFRVMIRPLQAVNMVHRQMAAMLESMAPPA